MTKSFQRGALGLLALGLAAPAQADVTPRDVWAQMEGYLTSFGYTMLAEPVTEGSTLRIPEMAMSMEVPTDAEAGTKGGTFTMRMGSYTFEELGDGTVAVRMPATMPFAVEGDMGGDEDFSLKGTLTTEGYSLIASGDPNDITYAFAATRMGVTLDEFTGDKGPMTTPGTIAFSFEGAEGTSRIADGDGTMLEQVFNVARVVYDVDITSPDPEKPGHFKWQGNVSNLVSTGTGTLPRGFAVTDMNAAVAAGYAVAAEARYGAGEGVLDFTDTKTSFRMATNSQGGALQVGMSAEGLLYDVSVRDVAVELESSDVPFPIATGMKALGLGIAVPVQASDQDQPFRASLTLTDVIVPDMVWMMADPNNSLPHDPVTAEIDLTGQGKLFVDLLNEDQMTQLGMTGGVPGELSTLVLEQLVIRAAGASITGSADIDIDNDKASLFSPDLPAFGMTADLRLTGVTGLIEKLSGMGLIPPGPAMMAAGMAKQLGRVETGPDDLSAAIVLTPEGALTVNDQPIPLR